MPLLKSLGPFEILDQAQKRLPQLSNQLQDFFNSYTEVVYGSNSFKRTELKANFKRLKSSYQKRAGKNIP